MDRLQHLCLEDLVEHRELEYLRAAGSARRKGRRPNGKQLHRAQMRWKKLRAAA